MTTHLWSGAIKSYEATFNVDYLSRAIGLMEVMVEDFSDENGGFYIGSKDAEKLMVEQKIAMTVQFHLETLLQ